MLRCSFSSDTDTDTDTDTDEASDSDSGSGSDTDGTSSHKTITNHATAELTRLSKLISQSQQWKCSRREAERLINHGLVTIAGEVVRSPSLLVNPDTVKNSIKVQGKLMLPNTVQQPRVWLVHKLVGEIVSEEDPHDRPSLMQRLMRGGLGNRLHLKAVGRLDMSTEGLILVTNDGAYKRQLELPVNKLHRIYRVRVHGKLAPYKLKAIRQGMKIENIRYRGMEVQIESRKRDSATNTWLKLTCVEGKNRQIRKVLNHLGLNVTRLIRVSYGDYELSTIPPGMALEVPMKPVEAHKRRGILITDYDKQKPRPKKLLPGEVKPTPIQWVKHT